MKRLNMFFGVLLLAAALYVANNRDVTPATQEPQTELAHVEIPASTAEGIVIAHEGFTLSFNTTTLCPDWVAWELKANETEGVASRKDYSFIEDEAVPRQYRANTRDYTGSGYDRGHMCPAADMKWSAAAMHDCHYMTNICPQEPELNQHWWERSETACRRWASREGSIYIVCGPIFTSKRPARIGLQHAVAVPDAFYKVVLSLRPGHEKAIGFYYTNDDSTQHLADAARPVDDIEHLTGIDFFPSLPDDMEERLERGYDLQEWN